MSKELAKTDLRRIVSDMLARGDLSVTVKFRPGGAEVFVDVTIAHLKKADGTVVIEQIASLEANYTKEELLGQNGQPAGAP